MSPLCVRLFGERRVLLDRLTWLDLAEFSRSKTLECYLGVDVKGFYTLVFIRTAKARLVMAEVAKLNELASKFELKFDANFKKRVLFYSSQLCSKAKIELKNSGWKCYDFM